MTLRDTEIIELLGDKPELFALADAVAETQRRRKPSVFRRTTPRVLTGAVVAAAAAIAVLLSTGGGGDHGIVGRALAAIGNGRVLHLVTQSPTGTVFVDLSTGRRTVQTFEYETWADRQLNRFHIVMRVHGRVVGDLLLPNDSNNGSVTVGRVDPAFAALWSGYRQALASGTARLERKGTVDGRAVYWLGFRSVQPHLPGTEVAIDARTYKPVLFRSYFSPVRHLDQRVLLAETTGFRASDFTRRGPSLLAGSGSGSLSSGGGSVEPPSNKPPIVRRPWLTPGPYASGLKLAAVNPLTVTAHGQTIPGLEIVYGSISSGLPSPRSLTIQELPRPDEPTLWKSIPRGSVAIQEGESSSSQGTHSEWTGYVYEHRIYVTIDTGRGEKAVVAVARALHLVAP